MSCPNNATGTPTNDEAAPESSDFIAYFNNPFNAITRAWTARRFVESTGAIPEQHPIPMASYLAVANARLAHLTEIDSENVLLPSLRAAIDRTRRRDGDTIVMKAASPVEIDESEVVGADYAHRLAALALIGQMEMEAINAREREMPAEQYERDQASSGFIVAALGKARE